MFLSRIDNKIVQPFWKKSSANLVFYFSTEFDIIKTYQSPQKKGRRKMTTTNNELWEAIVAEKQRQHLTLTQTARELGYKNHASLMAWRDGVFDGLGVGEIERAAQFIKRPVPDVLHMIGVEGFEEPAADPEIRQVMKMLKDAKKQNPAKYEWVMQIARSALESATER
jgi:hypothetical protein